MCWFLWREENRRTRRKTLGARTRTNNKLNPHMAPDWNRTRTTLVVGKRYHHCAIPAPSYISVCTRMYPYVLVYMYPYVLVCTRMYPFVFVCFHMYSYISVCTRIYPYALVYIRMHSYISVCTRIYPYALVYIRMYSYITVCTRMYSYVSVCRWCFSHGYDLPRRLRSKSFSASESNNRYLYSHVSFYLLTFQLDGSAS